MGVLQHRHYEAFPSAMIVQAFIRGVLQRHHHYEAFRSAVIVLQRKYVMALRWAKMKRFLGRGYDQWAWEVAKKGDRESVHYVLP